LEKNRRLELTALLCFSSRINRIYACIVLVSVGVNSSDQDQFSFARKLKKFHLRKRTDQNFGFQRVFRKDWVHASLLYEFSLVRIVFLKKVHCYRFKLKYNIKYRNCVYFSYIVRFNTDKIDIGFYHVKKNNEINLMHRI